MRLQHQHLHTQDVHTRTRTQGEGEARGRAWTRRPQGQFASQLISSNSEPRTQNAEPSTLNPNLDPSTLDPILNIPEYHLNLIPDRERSEGIARTFDRSSHVQDIHDAFPTPHHYHQLRSCFYLLSPFHSLPRLVAILFRGTVLIPSLPVVPSLIARIRPNDLMFRVLFSVFSRFSFFFFPGHIPLIFRPFAFPISFICSLLFPSSLSFLPLYLDHTPPDNFLSLCAALSLIVLPPRLALTLTLILAPSFPSLPLSLFVRPFIQSINRSHILSLVHLLPLSLSRALTLSLTRRTFDRIRYRSVYRDNSLLPSISFRSNRSSDEISRLLRTHPCSPPSSSPANQPSSGYTGGLSWQVTEVDFSSNGSLSRLLPTRLWFDPTSTSTSTSTSDHCPSLPPCSSVLVPRPSVMSAVYSSPSLPLSISLFSIAPCDTPSAHLSAHPPIRPSKALFSRVSPLASPGLLHPFPRSHSYHTRTPTPPIFVS